MISLDTFMKAFSKMFCIIEIKVNLRDELLFYISIGSSRLHLLKL